jgi:hypothetical protein
MRRLRCSIILPVSCFCFVLLAAGIAFGWHDKTHLAIAKAAEYDGWYNAVGADIAKITAGDSEATNHWFSNNAGVVVTEALVLDQVEQYNKASDLKGHLYGAIIASLREYFKDKKGGRYAEYHMAFCAHYIGDLSMPLHNVPYDDFNKNHHGANDSVIEVSALNNIGLIQKNMYPVVINDAADLAREIARIANGARQLALKIMSENRDMTHDEAYIELSHSASLLRAVLSYAKEKK